MHLMHLAHQPATVIAVVAAYKYAKFRLVCWRCSVVNSEVCAIANKRLDRDEDEDSASKCSQDCCPECKAPLWLRWSPTDGLVQLERCGCVVHSSCLSKIVKRQHGIVLPSISDPYQFLVVLRRIFGVDAIAVDSIECPACGTKSDSWKRVPEVRNVLTAAAPTAVATALRRGDALCLETLKEALIAALAREGEDKKSALIRWGNAAAEGDKPLCNLLQEEGADVSSELAMLMGEPPPRVQLGSPDEVDNKPWGSSSCSQLKLYTEFLWANEL
mmetsp:Transcript_20527/g.36902  ORF Transcript_20527/g.36902 Transcript_20527/m.36902 type:complete len:273 (-) Transcript_20527:62-880(-)